VISIFWALGFDKYLVKLLWVIKYAKRKIYRKINIIVSLKRIQVSIQSVHSIHSRIRPECLSAGSDRLVVLNHWHHFLPSQGCNCHFVLFEYVVELELHKGVVLQQILKMLLTVCEIPSQLFIVLQELPVYSVQFVYFILNEGHLLLLLISALLYFV